MVTRFKNLIPATLITRSVSEILKFRKSFKNIILKPLYGNGGKDVFFLKSNDPNFSVLLDKFLLESKEPIIIQEFLSNVKRGDKRILLLDGVPVGALNRFPQKGEIRSNLHIGGIAKKTNLNKKDFDICSAIGPYLKEKGLLFAGIDVIDGKLTEINVTSPTCIQEIDKLNKTNISRLIWDSIKNKKSR